MAFYEEGVGSEALESTPDLSKQAMAHMSFLFGYFYIIMASIVVCLVYTHDSPRLGMSIILVFWGVNVFDQILYPWPNVNEGAVLRVLGIPSPGATPSIVFFLALGGLAYVKSPHDLAHRAKNKSS